MRYQIDKEVESTNAKNNIRFLVSAFSVRYATNSLSSVNYKDAYPSISSRMNSALQSMVNLYMVGDIDYSLLNHYLSIHNRATNNLLTTIQIQGRDELTNSSFEARAFVRNLDYLDELLEQLD